MSNDKLKNNSDNKEALEKRFQELGNLLYNIKNDFDKYQAHFSMSNDHEIIERLISIEKDFENINNSFNELKNDVSSYKKDVDNLNIQYQELMGAINQLKLSIDEINHRYTAEQEQKMNIFWQLFIPIILSILFFVFGIFFKSCSSIHNQNINGGENKSEYINFESNK